MKGESRYVVKLKDLSSYSNRPTLNFIGVVVEFSVPRRTSGTDYCTILKIIDQSQQSPELSVNVFMRNIDELPHLLAHKDIILLCNFKVESFNENPYAVFDHKKSSFALFHGEITNEFTPYQASPTFYSARSDDDFVRRLRNWSKITNFDAGLSSYATPLKDIGGHDFIDLVCKVLLVREVSNGKWMIFLWDGTDAPALDLSAEPRADELNPLPLQVEPTILPPCILCNFPRIGTVFRVTIDETYENFGHHFRIVREWARIRNLQCRTVSGLWKGVWIPNTKIRPLSKNDNSVTGLMRYYTERISSYLSPSIMPNFLTDVEDYGQGGFKTLMELLTSPLGSGKFKCVVRFLVVYPSQAKEFRSPAGEYRMKITLEDPTARINALLSSDDAVDFFGGYLDVDELATKMNKLLGVAEGGAGNSTRNPAWTICCVGFNSPDGDDVVGSREYYICNTKLLV